jgi:hypothetical protein
VKLNQADTPHKLGQQGGARVAALLRAWGWGRGWNVGDLSGKVV